MFTQTALHVHEVCHPFTKFLFYNGFIDENQEIIRISFRHERSELMENKKDSINQEIRTAGDVLNEMPPDDSSVAPAETGAETIPETGTKAVPETSTVPTDDAFDTSAFASDSFEATETAGGSGGGDEPPIFVKQKRGKRRDRKRREITFTTGRLVLLCIVIVLISALLSFGLLTAYNTNRTSYRHLNNSSLTKSTGSEMTIEEIAELNSDAVVEIQTRGTQRTILGSSVTEGAGSGVIINEEGYIVTNFHVIDETNSITVRLHNGETYSAEVVGYDEQEDIAILKINAQDLTSAAIGSSDELAVGDLAVVIGNPLGQLGGTVTQGIISSTDREISLEGRTRSLIQTDAAINSGNSGGGLFNSKGELVGIVVAKGEGVGVEGLGFAIPIDSVAKQIDDIIENGTVTGRPAIGISVSDATYSRSNQPAGAYIEEVTGDNAKEAGLKTGDVITAVDENTVTTANELIEAVQKYNIGDTVELTIIRDGKEKTVEIELESTAE